MAIRTKWLKTDRQPIIGIVLGIDDIINYFLEENPFLEVIDIKYQSNVYVVDDTTYYNDSALIIYKEEEE